jgi:hypothetical protein
LSDIAADAEWWQEESKRECQVWVEEVTLLQNQDSELCLAIVSPPRVRSHLLDGMRIIALCHTEMAE